MSDEGLCRVGLYLAPEDHWAAYYREAAEHAGLVFSIIDGRLSERLAEFDVVLLCGYGSLSSHQVGALVAWIEGGGVTICSGSCWGLESVLGLEIEPDRHPSSDVLVPPEGACTWWPEEATPARFFGGAYATALDCDVEVAVESGYVGASRATLGEGMALFFAAHVGQTMSQMQLGRAVESDGIGPNDGSARLDDRNLRAEDGIALSFDVDRSILSGCDTPFFHQPHADVVKELWVRMALDAIRFSEKIGTLLWQWPNGSDGVVALSVDCESSDQMLVYGLRRLFEMYGVRACWFVTTHGFPVDLYRAMRKWGDDIGLLFSTDDHLGWQEEKLKVQAFCVNRLASVPRLHPVRPIDGKWKGYLQFYDLAESAGARISVSKGGRQPGTSGFAFGTCHPFFPCRRDGSSYFVAELPNLVFQPGKSTPSPIVDQMMRQVALRSGCLGATITSAVGGEAKMLSDMQRLVVQVRQSRLSWLPAGALYQFEKARRSLRCVELRSADAVGLAITSDSEIQGLHVLFLGKDLEIEVGGGDSRQQVVRRYGFDFTSVRIDLDPKSRAEIRVRPSGTDEVAA